MAALSIGKGISGIMMNMLQVAILLMNREFTDYSHLFHSTLTFYIVAVSLLFLVSSLYFVEKSNDYSQYYYKQIEMQNKKRQTQSIFKELKEIFASSKLAWTELFYIVQILLVTFIAFPGVIIHMETQIFEGICMWK